MVRTMNVTVLRLNVTVLRMGEMKTKTIYLPETVGERINAIILIPTESPAEQQQRINRMRAEMGPIGRKYPGGKASHVTGNEDDSMMIEQCTED